jgi:hypothetical protein
MTQFLGNIHKFKRKTLWFKCQLTLIDLKLKFIKRSHTKNEVISMG